MLRAVDGGRAAALASRRQHGFDGRHRGGSRSSTSRRPGSRSAPGGRVRDAATRTTSIVTVVGAVARRARSSGQAPCRPHVHRRVADRATLDLEDERVGPPSGCGPHEERGVPSAETPDSARRAVDARRRRSAGDAPSCVINETDAARAASRAARSSSPRTAATAWAWRSRSPTTAWRERVRGAGRIVDTCNADVNAHMNAVNERLGLRVRRTLPGAGEEALATSEPRLTHVGARLRQTGTRRAYPRQVAERGRRDALHVLVRRRDGGLRGQVSGSSTATSCCSEIARHVRRGARHQPRHPRRARRRHQQDRRRGLPAQVPPGLRACAAGRSGPSGRGPCAAPAWPGSGSAACSAAGWGR